MALSQLEEEPLCRSFQANLLAGPGPASGLALITRGDTRAIQPLLQGVKSSKIHLDDPSWDALLSWLCRLSAQGGPYPKAYQRAVQLRVKVYMGVILGIPATISVMHPRFTEEVQEHQLQQMRQHEQESLAATRNLIELGKQYQLDLTSQLKLIVSKPAVRVGWLDWKESFLFRPEAPKQGQITFDFAQEKELARQALRR
jgi:hypothetical protein